MKTIEYLSSDKLYKIKKKKLNDRGKILVSILFFLFFSILSLSFFKLSIYTDNGKLTNAVDYSENGNIDYKIYLKDNNYYNTTYLEKGMQYVAGLIKTVNVRFDYQIHSTKNIDIDANYSVIADLQITERNDSSKLLFSKKDKLIDNKKIKVNDNNLTINEEFDIDYDKYNGLANSYKRDYGLVVSSNLVLTFEINANGTYNKTQSVMDKSNQMQMVIPLLEQTVDISMDTNEIKDSGRVIDTNNKFKVENLLFFVLFIVTSLIALINFLLSIYFIYKYSKKDIYRSKVNKLLRDYDRIIVNGKISIDEKKYTNKIQPDSFEDMVDAAQTLGVPIYYYEAIENEKCFFVIVKDDTLYKYRITRAFLEKNSSVKKK